MCHTHVGNVGCDGQICLTINNKRWTDVVLLIPASRRTLVHCSLLSRPSPSLLRLTAFWNCLRISSFFLSSFFLLFIKNQLILMGLPLWLLDLFYYRFWFLIPFSSRYLCQHEVRRPWVSSGDWSLRMEQVGLEVVTLWRTPTHRSWHQIIFWKLLRCSPARAIHFADTNKLNPIHNTFKFNEHTGTVLSIIYF